jgi:hypothetical protein
LKLSPQSSGRGICVNGITSKGDVVGCDFQEDLKGKRRRKKNKKKTVIVKGKRVEVDDDNEEEETTLPSVAPVAPIAVSAPVAPVAPIAVSARNKKYEKVMCNCIPEGIESFSNYSFL